MVIRKVGGRKLPHEPGTLRYEEDEFRGQRRRPWMCFRVGAPSKEIEHPDMWRQIISKTHEKIISCGILLDGEAEFIKYTLCHEDYDLLENELRKGLDEVKEKYEEGPMSLPITILFLDTFDPQRINGISDRFSEYMYIIKIEQHEVLAWAASEDYSELEVYCEQFADFICEIENLPESRAVPVPIEHRLVLFGNSPVPSIGEGKENVFSKNSTSETIFKTKKDDMYNGASVAPPPGLGPPGLHGPSSSRNRDYADTERIEPPPGLPSGPPGIPNRRDARPPGLPTPQIQRPLLPKPKPKQDVEVNGPHILPIESVRAARRLVKDDDSERGMPIKKNENDMARYINGSKLYERFGHPFVSLDSNLDLLYTINYAISTRNKEVHSMCKEIIRRAFERGYPISLKRKYLDGPFLNGKWCSDAAEMLFELFHLYFYTARFKGSLILSAERFIPSWEELVESLGNTRQEGLGAAGVTSREMENLRKLSHQINKWIDQANERPSTSATHREEPTPRHEEPRQEPRCDERHHDDRRYEEHRYNDRYEDRRHEEPRHDDRRYEEPRHYENESRRHERQNSYDYGSNEPDHVETRPPMQEMVSNSPPPKTRNKYSVEEEDEPPKVNEMDVINTDEQKKQAYKYETSEFIPLWKSSERCEPPEDFRTLSSVPTLKDYMNPEEPYLRRIQEDGIYKSAAHYLDVQFRLMREDLVSPLRDGIDLYKKNGTCKGRRIEGVPCSDVTIFNIERVEGKQVTERDGFEMRIVYPFYDDVNRLMDSDKEMKELGLMILSNDRFDKDFHLTYVHLSLLQARGCLQLVILDETGPFKPNTAYQMAQGTSYLPSYRHVLENMKRISPFKPIPFERYLVRGKREIFRPTFHRHDKDALQLHEEQNLLDIYGDIRSGAVAARFKKRKPIPKSVEGDDDDEYRSASTSNKKDEEDIEYDQLNEPIFREMIGVSNGGSDQIKIDQKWYRISSLLDDFQPDYLDDSQRVAFCQTFRNEMSLIQGPPGTGKTHIGVKILKTMLQNRSHWRMTEPILIVCFTNSGLDNLLERVWRMIDEDEELSKDTGKPRMIRYGSKCESDFLKRCHVMRYDVHEQYKQFVSEAVQREQSKASSQKRKKGEEVALASYTLYCSRNDLLSYEIMSRVMRPEYQAEVCQFARDHVDSKENPLNYDEAFACWLLDRDMKKSKIQTKNQKDKSKFRSLDDDSDEEESKALPMEESDDEEELDDEQMLDKLLRKMNMQCTGKDVLGGAKSRGEADEYHTKSRWEIMTGHSPTAVVLLGRREKQGHPVDEHIISQVDEVKKMIMECEPLQKEQLADIKFIYSLARPKRWALYQTWCEEVRILFAGNLPIQIAEYRTACKTRQKAFDKFDAEIMKMPMVIGATTSGCSRLRPLLEMAKPRILVVEEAAEVLEAHIISAMISSVEHVVMIGDHKQLRPSPSVHELGVEYGMRISMFERLVERGFPYCQLKEQHRMNTTITDLIVRPSFYSNVYDAENVMSYPPVEGLADKLFFWAHANAEETPDGISWMNRREAVMTVALVKHLLKQSYTSSDIVVLATYAAQRNYMYREFPYVFGTSDAPVVPIETVDSFQGRERKIAILSLVRSHRGCPQNTGIGFLAVANRICVALTRAQHGMYIIGNGAYLMNNSPLWKSIVQKLDTKSLVSYDLRLKCSAHENITLVNNPEDFAEKSPEGGCLEICNLEKPCGHSCRRRCHPNVIMDHLAPCEETCGKKCSNPKYRHACVKRCYEDCSSCMFYESVQLACGHSITTPCSMIPIARCDQRCTKYIACGHKCTEYCGVTCSEPHACREAVDLELKCGHVKAVPCGDLTSGVYDKTCVEPCGQQMLFCEHRCKNRCGEQCTYECVELANVTLRCGHSQDVICSQIDVDKSTDLIKCTTEVPAILEPCGHGGHVLCGNEPSTEYCNERCKELLADCGHYCGNECGVCFKAEKHVCQQFCQKVLDCKHECGARCGETCPPCKAFCGNSCEHLSCGAGGNGFGRNCNDVCISCVANCSNKCVHRSCTLKCYEECNVKTCAEACANTLRCGHACLGMCGEVCPTVCGTCERSKYLSYVSDLLKNSQKIHRLIMLPRCHHIFAVETLDEHISEMKEKDDILRCPKCSIAIIGVLRYAKYTKKRALEKNLQKMRKRVRNSDSNEILSKIRKTYNNANSILGNLAGNSSREVSRVVQKFRQMIFTIEQKALEIGTRAENRWQLAGISDALDCCDIAARLVSFGFQFRVVRQKNIPPTVAIMLTKTFGELPLNKMMRELQSLIDEMEPMWLTGLVGSFMPKTRFQLAKMVILVELNMMMYHLSEIEKRDFSESDGRQIAAACNVLFMGNERQNFVGHTTSIENTLRTIVPKIGEPKLTWNKVNVPEF